MTDIGVLVGGEKSKTREQMEKVIAFERIIANVSKLLGELAIKFSHIVVPEVKMPNQEFLLINIFMQSFVNFPIICFQS